MDDQFYSFAKFLLQKNPKKRPTAKKVLKRKMLSNLDP
jgi:hypothetical protein